MSEPHLRLGLLYVLLQQIGGDKLMKGTYRQGILRFVDLCSEGKRTRQPLPTPQIYCCYLLQMTVLLICVADTSLAPRDCVILSSLCYQILGGK